ncbi:hypothetical protein [Staphylococcus phage vB_SauM-T-SE-G1]|nr:hypothetical protein CUBB_gp69 [Staphylococcus phage CUB-B]
MLRYLVVLLYINYNILYTPCQVNFKKNYRSRDTYLLLFNLHKDVYIVVVYTGKQCKKKTVMCKVFVLLLITL